MKMQYAFLLFFSSILILSAQKPLDYKPDFSKSDIYLPHLKRIPLSGWWKLEKVSSDRKNNPNDKGSVEKYYSADYDDSGWGLDLVPNNIHVPFLMKDIPKTTDWGAMHKALPRAVREWGGIAWFRKEFTVPVVEKNERAILTFDEVLGDFTLFVNGKKIGEGTPFVPVTGYRGPHIPQSFDISDAILPGKKNVIALRLFHDGFPVRWGWAGYAGITDLVYLDVRPPVYTSNILVTPQKNLKDILFECILSGSSESANTDDWTGEIFEWNSGKKTASVKFGKRYEEDKQNLVSGMAHLTNPKLWSCESPFLYGIKVRNAQGKVVGVQRFGVRTFGVKDGNFVLNGKPVALRGLVIDGLPFPLYRHGWFHAFRFNANDINRTYWRILAQDGNLNHVRMHSATCSRGLYDILDEFGVLVTDELRYPEVSIKSPTRSDMISVKGFDGAADKLGNLRPEFIRKTKERIRRSYSHPSICTYSFGNEIRQYDNPQVENMLNNLYDLFGKVDKQNRPRTNSSGRFWKEARNIKELAEREKFDYIDTHDYSGSINSSPLAYCEPVVKHFAESVHKYCGSNKYPVVNGEAVYFCNRYFPQKIDPIWNHVDDKEPANWDKFLYAMNSWKKKEADTAFLAFYWLRNWGTKNYKFNRYQGAGIYTEGILEIQRKFWPEQDGYETLCTAYLLFGNAFPFEDMQITKTKAFPYFARVNSPAIAILDYIAPNRFTGEDFSSLLTVVNNKENDLKNIRFEMFFEQNGKKYQETFLNLGDIASSEKKKFPLKQKTPSGKGNYRMVYRLVSNGEIQNERDRPINLRERSDVFRKIPSAKKIAVYDSSSVFGSLKPYSTQKMLKKFSVPFTDLRSFERLNEFEVLIIGNNSIDGKIQNNGNLIRKFAENGGRILVFDQNTPGRIPFLPELEYVLAGPGQFREIIRSGHPALNGLSQNEFFCWNQNDWSVYHNYIMPLSKAVILSGGDTSGWGADNFGMIAAHLKLGKGDILLCQAEVTETMNVDSAAAQFSRGLLETILDDSTRRHASDFTGYPLPKTKPLSQSKALYISLKDTANRAFADKTANDGKGGWTDQGPLNDLRAFPLGKRDFNRIPFEIINPDSNGGRSCIMVSNNPNRRLKPDSGKIVVNAKLKRLLFLHSGAWVNEEKKIQAGEYMVSYESGRTVSIPLIAGENIGDWWNASSKRFPNAECAWSTMNGSGTVGVYLFEWNNPYPEDTIRGIVLKGQNKAVLGLIGLTGEKF